jgi:hypothetical protein
MNPERKKLLRDEQEARAADENASAEAALKVFKRYLARDRDGVEVGSPEWNELQRTEERLRNFENRLHVEGSPLYGELRALIAARKLREDQSAAERRQAEKDRVHAAFLKALPAHLDAHRKALAGDETSPELEATHRFLGACTDLTGAERGALVDLKIGHAARVQARLQREREEAELAGRERLEREEREREEAWRRLPREVRAGEMFVRALPSVLRPAFRALLAALTDASFDPQAAPSGWEPGRDATAALLARIPSELPFEPTRPPERRELEGRRYGRGFQMNSSR